MALESQTQLYGSSSYIPINNLLAMDLENAVFFYACWKENQKDLYFQPARLEISFTAPMKLN